MSDRVGRRAAVLEKLTFALQEDPRLAGLVLVGSGADGFVDDESDIDLTAPVDPAHDPESVYADWKERIRSVIPVRYRSETAFTEAHRLLVLLCDDLLEVDLSFPALASLVALAPRWRILWDRTGEVAARMAIPASRDGAPSALVTYQWTLNRVFHRALHGGKWLRRGQVWRALVYLDELRRFALQLACWDSLGDDDVESRVDDLPPDVLAVFAASLPEEASLGAVFKAISSTVEAALVHARNLDMRFGVSLSEPMSLAVREHLEGTRRRVFHDP